MFDALMAVAPAFQTVTSAAAAAVNTFNSIASQLSPSFGASNAKGVLDASVDAWRALGLNNQRTRDQTIQDIADLISSGNIGSALTYAQALGGNAVNVLNAMLSAYQAWQQALNNTSNNNIPAFTGAVDNAAAAAAALAAAQAAAAAQIADARRGLGSYLDSLLLGHNSPLDPMQQLAEAQRQYQAMLTSAQHGDLAGIQGLQAAHTAYLDIARQLFGSSSPFIEIFERTFNEVAGVAGVADYNTRMLAIGTMTNTLLENIASSSLRVEKLLDIIAGVTTDSGEKVANAVSNSSVELR